MLPAGPPHSTHSARAAALCSYLFFGLRPHPAVLRQASMHKLTGLGQTADVAVGDA